MKKKRKWRWNELHTLSNNFKIGLGVIYLGNVFAKIGSKILLRMNSQGNVPGLFLQDGTRRAKSLLDYIRNRFRILTSDSTYTYLYLLLFLQPFLSTYPSICECTYACMFIFCIDACNLRKHAPLHHPRLSCNTPTHANKRDHFPVYCRTIV